MKYFSLILLGLALSFQAKAEIVEVTAPILSLESNGRFPYAVGIAEYEYGCAESYKGVELVEVAPIRGVRQLRVRVVLNKNTRIRCIWQNPRIGEAVFSYDNRGVTQLQAVQPIGWNPNPQPPPSQEETTEINDMVSAVLTSGALQEQIDILNRQRIRGTLKISSFSSFRRRGGNAVVKAHMERHLMGREMRREVQQIGYIRFDLSIPVGGTNYQVLEAYFVPAIGANPVDAE